MHIVGSATVGFLTAWNEQGSCWSVVSCMEGVMKIRIHSPVLFTSRPEKNKIFVGEAKRWVFLPWEKMLFYIWKCGLMEQITWIMVVELMWKVWIFYWWKGGKNSELLCYFCIWLISPRCESNLKVDMVRMASQWWGGEEHAAGRIW
jgi:hypothetical protein